MDPNQPTPGQYDFILNSGNKPQRNSLFNGGGSQKQRLLIVAVGVLILTIAAMLVMSILSNANKQSFDDSLNLVAIQRKIIQASDEAVSSSPNADTRARAATILATFKSDTKQLESFLNENGQKKKLATVASTDQEIKQTLDKASSNNDFDSAYSKLLGELFNDYATELRKSNSESKSKSEKALLETSYQHIVIITKTDKTTTQ